MITCKDKKIEVANEVLKCFAPETSVRLESGHVLVEWTSYSGTRHSRRWMTRGQDFYPVWHHSWGHGGTASTALAQLVRWIQGKPVLPISTWRHWAGPKSQLLRHGNADTAIEAMLDAGYPMLATCVLCGETITGGLDWWSLKDVTGPCCDMRSGCQQRRNP